MSNFTFPKGVVVIEVSRIRSVSYFAEVVEIRQTINGKKKLLWLIVNIRPQMVKSFFNLVFSFKKFFLKGNKGPFTNNVRLGGRKGRGIVTRRWEVVKRNMTPHILIKH